ncbi:Glycosyl transferases group 1 [Pseudomonas oleovorans subsp. oleovorans]|uniref:PEP-CTERM/exosortase A-associated glycosyltransferase, Daro_2409 family n=1 Tax=Ectopseudomonas oleovorans TaxID=301 RepID=A0A379PJI4_ECTOL|nr:glycosyltransferase family 4 protein [Pseudomonas oleovorans]OWK40078.1 Glycosyl transferases group 1 [Pseudomonas oleovorans subsp. oleovorans]SEJ28240.1 Glycosyl transferase 4-like domain-containing protein [Pseudomonas oleovorans]SUD51458.1 PEP-CTERM/exosortase A-associated glycosyltransferase, Daro_2409 family [Pseudomonas oleovorans]SUE72817.1 PEP-CTERM/exosortase A-associated glycosyltransferase, Daro_2409 family [Pseudomonas oleovorans]
MSKVFYIQPILTSYRQDLVTQLEGVAKLTILCDVPTNKSGFSTVRNDKTLQVRCPHLYLLGGRLLWQQGVRKAVIQDKPEVVLACANVRDLTYWWLLFWARRNGVKVFSHGQGLYSKRHVGGLIAWLYRTAARLSHRYVCYTELSRQTMLAAGCPPEKLAVADNAIRFSVDAANMQKTSTEQGVLFVGRLREQCNLEHLVDAVARLRIRHPEVVLHVVGSGELEADYRARFDQVWVIFHGAVYDDARILEISRDCRVGCYPGNAGLSVVHYFALRLPPLVHSDMPAHMGPEPSYVQDGVNGMLFSREQKAEGIAAALEKIWGLPIAEYQALSTAAFSEYERLNSPSMGEKMVRILRD